MIEYTRYQSIYTTAATRLCDTLWDLKRSLTDEKQQWNDWQRTW